MSLKKHIPNTITSLNLLAGAVGVILALKGHVDLALPVMLLAAVFDFCDGLAARLLGAYSPVGKELDSLADMVSFGVLPSMMMFETMWSAGAGHFSWITLFPAVMSGVRLAKFNTDTRQGESFLGLPTPSSALVAGSLSAFIAMNPESFMARWASSPVFLPAVSVVLGLLLVSEIPMFAFKFHKGGKADTILTIKRTAFLTVAVLSVIVTLVLRRSWPLAILLTFSAYIVMNCIFALFPATRC